MSTSEFYQMKHFFMYGLLRWNQLTLSFHSSLFLWKWKCNSLFKFIKICFHHIHLTTTSMCIFMFNNLFTKIYWNVHLTFEKIVICLYIFSVYSNFNLMIFKFIPLTVKWLCFQRLVTLLLIQECTNQFLNLNIPFIFERDLFDFMKE